MAGATLAAVAVAAALKAWHWRIDPPDSLGELSGLLRQLAWFTWPTLPLAVWTLWRWRLHWLRRHVSVPLSAALVALVRAA